VREFEETGKWPPCNYSKCGHVKPMDNWLCICMCIVGKTETNEQLETAVREANERLAALHNLERQSVRSALIEERGRLCLFVCGLKPVMVGILCSVLCTPFLRSDRHHLSCDDCLEDKREGYRNCSVSK